MNIDPFLEADGPLGGGPWRDGRALASHSQTGLWSQTAMASRSFPAWSGVNSQIPRPISSIAKGTIRNDAAKEPVRSVKATVTKGHNTKPTSQAVAHVKPLPTPRM